MIGCVLSGPEWWTHLAAFATLTLTARWIAVGVWHECQRERLREERRQWLEQQRDSRPR